MMLTRQVYIVPNQLNCYYKLLFLFHVINYYRYYSKNYKSRRRHKTLLFVFTTPLDFFKGPLLTKASIYARSQLETLAFFC